MWQNVIKILLKFFKQLQSTLWKRFIHASVYCLILREQNNKKIEMFLWKFEVIDWQNIPTQSCRVVCRRRKTLDETFDLLVYIQFRTKTQILLWKTSFVLYSIFSQNVRYAISRAFIIFPNSPIARANFRFREFPQKCEQPHSRGEIFSILVLESSCNSL